MNARWSLGLVLLLFVGGLVGGRSLHAYQRARIHAAVPDVVGTLLSPFIPPA